MKVYIAEKPSLGRAIAAVLAKRSPKVESRAEYVAGRGWVVCFAAGHIFELEEPDYYIQAKYPDAPKGSKGRFRWSYDHLPLVPGKDGFPDWALRPDKKKAALLSVIRKFVSNASVVVNAGDPDREGQLLIDEILETIKCRKPVRRVLISATDEVSVANALRDERDNRDFRGLRDAALARSRADWLCGMNFSRAVTLRARECGYNGSHVSIGRVQTPLLGLIVQRDLEIENFKPVEYFAISAEVAVPKGEFRAQWRPRKGQSGLDEEGRLLDRSVAEALKKRVTGKTGKIVEYEDEERQEGPLLPYSVDRLQVLASRKYGYKPDAVLGALQALYEEHGLTTYPRSDCQYLPVAQLADAPEVLRAIGQNTDLVDDQINAQLDPNRKSRAWNDQKVTAHHAIIPTTKRANIDALPKIQRDLYHEVCKAYIAQFMPPHRYRSVSATVEVEGEHFRATGRTTIAPGWRVLFGAQERDAKEEGGVLPPMKLGDDALCKGLNIESRTTEPPQHFTDATLLEAMVNVHKFVTDPYVKSIFLQMLADKKGGDEEGAAGLGTPATRHMFVPKLIEIGMVERVKSARKGSKTEYLVSTPAGRALIQALPGELGKPDMTALWEAAMREIESGKGTVGQFLDVQAAWVRKMIEKIRATDLDLPRAEVMREAVRSARGSTVDCGRTKGKAQAGETRKAA